MKSQEISITNNNEINSPSNDNYKAFNEFVFSDDLKLTGKFLHRFKYFLQTKDLPGDIVEVGVFKGSGVASFLKFIQIFCPNSNKKVVGFDIFSPDKGNEILTKDSELDKTTMNQVFDRVDHNELSLESVTNRLLKSKISSSKFKLIEGDVENSIPNFIKNNPGFRASLIYIDVDIERPTYYSLEHLWDALLPGGIILFDEYEYHNFSESCGVEKFLRNRQMGFELKSTNWIAPTAYLVKKSFSKLQ